MQQWIRRTPVSREAAGHNAAVDLQDIRQQNRAGHQAMRISRTSGRRGAAGHQDAEDQ